jgi:hypothetical protein
VGYVRSISEVGSSRASARVTTNRGFWQPLGCASVRSMCTTCAARGHVTAPLCLLHRAAGGNEQNKKTKKYKTKNKKRTTVACVCVFVCVCVCVCVWLQQGAVGGNAGGGHMGCECELFTCAASSRVAAEWQWWWQTWGPHLHAAPARSPECQVVVCRVGRVALRGGWLGCGGGVKFRGPHLHAVPVRSPVPSCGVSFRVCVWGGCAAIQLRWCGQVQGPPLACSACQVLARSPVPGCGVSCRVVCVWGGRLWFDLVVQPRGHHLHMLPARSQC